MDVIAQLKESVSTGKRGRIREIAEGSGVSIKVLRNVFYGYTQDMRHSNAQRLEEFFERERATAYSGPERRKQVTKN